MTHNTLNRKSLPDDGSIVIIIVNYNGGEIILECLRSLERQTYSNHHIVIIDNQSTDGSLQQARKLFPHISVIENGYNAGFGVACNIGIQATVSEYVVFFNNDAYMDKHCLEELVKTIESGKKYGSCASKVLLWDKPDTIEVAGVAIHRDGLSVGRGRLQSADNYNKVEEVFCGSGCCCLYRRDMLNEIGLCDPDFFMYAEDTDLGWKHQLAGWKCIYTPYAIAYHVHSRAAGSYSDFKVYHVERNRIYICLKYFPFWHLIASFFFSLYRYFYQFRIAWKGQGALAKYREQSSLWQGLKVLAVAHIDAIRMAPVMLKRGRKYRSTRRLSDEEMEDLFRRYGASTREMAIYK